MNCYGFFKKYEMSFGLSPWSISILQPTQKGLAEKIYENLKICGIFYENFVCYDGIARHH